MQLELLQCKQVILAKELEKKEKSQNSQLINDIKSDINKLSQNIEFFNKNKKHHFSEYELYKKNTSNIFNEIEE